MNRVGRPKIKKQDRNRITTWEVPFDKIYEDMTFMEYFLSEIRRIHRHGKPAKLLTNRQDGRIAVGR